MNPIYKFQLSAGHHSRQAHPIYKDDLAIDYALEQGHEFYRGKLSGKLTFQREDYAFIRNKAFDTQFDIVISISYDGGQTWAVYWSGQFWKTDCEFNEDDQTVIVTPTVNDRYNAVLAGMEKEYNLIDLTPNIEPIKMDKRPMIQVYVPGQTVIGCFLSGMWWEQECNAVDNETVLQNTYHFTLNRKCRQAELTEIISGPISPQIPYTFLENSGVFPLVSGNYRIEARTVVTTGWWLYIVRISDNTDLWYYRVGNTPTPPLDATFTPVPNSGATGTFKMYIHDVAVFARYITDVQTQYEIPDNDIVENNRNYHYIAPYNFPNTIRFLNTLTQTPTKWGIYEPGEYYVSPADIPSMGIDEAFPVAHAAWGRISLWYVFSINDWENESLYRKEYILKDSFPIWSVLSVILAKIAPGITHDGTTDYSQFLYQPSNPVVPTAGFKLFITPKSNLISAGYDQPAQKAPITLKYITDMLRDCFRCYWFIDEQNRFRVEHISWFMRGGTYTGQPVVGIDLTKQIVTRNGKPWSYVRNQYQFDKPEMAARYQFGWMDDVTDVFEGLPIDIISKYVNPENIEQIDVAHFTSDVDYILLNPGAVSKDGFVLLAPIPKLSGNELPYINFVINGANHIVQNPYVSFRYLELYFYMYDMPARNVEINGVPQYVRGIKKLKTQTIKFPVLTEPDMFNLIKTKLGNGTIQKMSVNLSSRNANTTLKYDTE